MFQYLPLEESDFEIMVELYKKYLNDGELIDQHLKEGMESDGYIGFKCVSEGGEVCGLFTAGAGIDFTCGHLDLAEKIRTDYPYTSIYTADMLVVKPEYRQYGIAAELVLKLRDKLHECGVDFFLAELWRVPDGRLPGKVVLEVGKEIEHTFYPNFYKDIAKYGLSCPICGKDCICGADICLMELTEN